MNTLSIHSLAIDSFAPMLRSLANMLDKGAEHANARKLDPAALVQGRLAPDMYTLRQQVQLACHHARDAVARLTGREGAPPEEIGLAWSDLKARIQTTIALLQETRAGAFEGAEDRTIVIPVSGADMVFEMTGYPFLRDWALPHFYFHVVTAYGILRHNGVDIGKRDYMGNVGRYFRKPVPSP
jgi:hypothetical protein